MVEKISFYGLTYQVLDYLQRSLESFSDPRLDITIVESQTRSTIRTYLADKVADGTISRAICFKHNVRGVGLLKAIELFPPKGNFFILSDMDLVMNKGWLDKSIASMQDISTTMSGFPLSLENFDPVINAGHNPNQGLGIWALSIKTSLFEAYPKDYNLVDQRLFHLAQKYGTVVRIDDTALHLTWELHKEPEYADYVAQKRREAGWFPTFRSEILGEEDYEII